MQVFLKNLRNILYSQSENNEIIFVIGNESCDLDSAICAILLAKYYKHSSESNGDNKKYFVPVLNLHRENLPLKTEVVFMLKRLKIDSSDLICL